MRLSNATIEQCPTGIARPGYSRDQGVGIVHFGLGAFHRAHQADYVDRCLSDGERDWMIAGVSLRSNAVQRQLEPQDGLYTLVQKGADSRVIGAVREALVAGPDDARILHRIAAPECRIVSFTVTEKGYCRGADGTLNRELARQSFYPLLGKGMRRRRESGLPGITLLSCDNLSDNGRQLRRLLGEWLEQDDPDTARWLAAECTAPNTMVDRIVPASADADLDRLEQQTGLRDEAAVFTEPFSQWVIEDDFAGPVPGWAKHGVELVADVAPYETAKLRMLNGAHSALAYLGLARGHTFVHEAVADEPLRALIERLMLHEAAPTIDRATGQDLETYAARLIERFANPALEHRLAQIAMDGSEKVPQRWLDTLAWQAARGTSCPALLTALAGWLRHLRGEAGPVNDPREAELAALLAAHSGETAVRTLLVDGPIAAAWQPTEDDVTAIARTLGNLPELPPPG